jgi:PIN domain nuclease of toxin-antitoxin system
MAEVMHLDTHVVVWMVMEEYHRLPGAAIKRVNASLLMVSPIVILELQYLVDKKKIEGNALKFVEKLREKVGLEICEDSFESVIRASLHLSWTRDPFDRLIVANASMAKTPLLTRDRKIHDHYSRAVWE